MTKSKTKRPQYKNKYSYCYRKFRSGANDIVVYRGNKPYRSISVCPNSYGIIPNEKCCVVSENIIGHEVYADFKQKLVKKELTTVYYGPYNTPGTLVELVDNWKELCEPVDDIF